MFTVNSSIRSVMAPNACRLIVDVNPCMRAAGLGGKESAESTIQSNKPLRDWFKLAHLMLASKEGISARQLWRYMGFGSRKTAWYMARRLPLCSH